MTKTTS